jgi:hypothetical protein
MNIESFPQTIEKEITKLVAKKDGRYYPLIKPEDIDRDLFFHLRSQLISLGCAKDDVLRIAKMICMELLQLQSEEEYLQYVFEDTYHKCRENIKSGYDPFPIQDLQNLDYSHTNLFSSIYGFEIEYLKSRGIYSDIADIGCGEGILAKLANDYLIEIDGYEIVKPIFCHDDNIHLIEDYHDINKNYKCLIFNHVLEHIRIKPDDYLSSVIDYFVQQMSNDKLQVIFISLPMHTHIYSHIASKHHWVCTNDIFIETETRNAILQNGLDIFYPFIAFSKIAKRFDFKLTVKNEMGLYVFERQ